jgi:hypothetical protein
MVKNRFKNSNEIIVKNINSRIKKERISKANYIDYLSYGIIIFYADGKRFGKIS